MADETPSKSDISQTNGSVRDGFHSPGGTFRPIALIVVLCPVLSFPFVLFSAIASWENNSNDLISWADDSLPIKQEFESFVQRFGRPELVVVSWEGCRWDSTELNELRQRIDNPDLIDWFGKVVTARVLINRIEDLPGRSDERAIVNDITGILVGSDGVTGCLVAEFGPVARTKRFEAVQKLHEAAEAVGVPQADLIVGGIGAEIAWIDHESVVAPARLMPLTAASITFLSILLLRSFRLGLFVCGLGTFTGTLSAALIHWCGVQSNAILATLPTLGALLAVSLTLHFVAYYRSAASEIQDPAKALQLAFSWGFGPTVLSATTTTIGLGSLMLSRTNAIQEFGFFGALITVCAAVLTLTVVPAFLLLMPERARKTPKTDGHIGYVRWAGWLESNSAVVVTTILCGALVAGYGLRSLKTGISVDNLFVSNHEIVHHDRWLESHIGPLSSFEVTLSAARDDLPNQTAAGDDDDSSSSAGTFMRSFLALQDLDAHLNEYNEFRISASATTGIENINSMRRLRGLATRGRLSRWLDENQAELIETGLYSESHGRHCWRMSIRVPTINKEKGNVQRRRLATILDQFVAEHQLQNPDLDLQYSVTGLPLLFEQIETQFVNDLKITYFGGLALITVAVFVVLRSATDSLIAMAPNLLPAVGVLGFLSLCGVVLDVGSIMTASIALGVAVDDTMHLLLWYQRTRSNGTAVEAVRSAISHCGAPILQTSIVCGTGLAVLGFAPFMPTLRFGTLIAMMLVVALIGDLLLLPAMLFIRGRRLDDTLSSSLDASEPIKTD